MPVELNVSYQVSEVRADRVVISVDRESVSIDVYASVLGSDGTVLASRHHPVANAEDVMAARTGLTRETIMALADRVLQAEYGGTVKEEKA